VRAQPKHRGILGTLASVFNDLNKGHKAGFRKCCIAWFAFVYHPAIDLFPELKFRYFRRLWWRLPGSWSIYNVQYIPCPLCMARRSFDKSEPFHGYRPPVDMTLEDYDEIMGEMMLDEEQF
jgi:hypothetical protein